MYFNNDSMQQQTGLSSCSLSQLILLLLTSLMGRESSLAACLPATFLEKGGLREEMDREHREQKKQQKNYKTREEPVCFPV